MWIDQQSNICRKLKCTFQSFLKCVECLTQKPLLRRSPEMTVILCSHFGLVKLTYFAKFTFIIAYYFGSTSTCEVTSFFASV